MVVRLAKNVAGRVLMLKRRKGSRRNLDLDLLELQKI